MRSTKLRVLNTVIAGIVVCTLLVGCSTGSAPEAQRGQEKDAQKTSVISDMQATHTWDLINGTPDATPTETPQP